MDWFNKTLTDKQTVELFRKISYIPPEAWIDITERILDEYKPTAGNFPTIKQIKDLHRIWIHENPHKQAAFVKTKCEDCKSSGFIWVKVYNKENTFKELCYRCSSCLNWESQIGNEALPSITKQEALNRGMELVFT